MSRGMFLVVLILSVSVEHGESRGVVGQEYNLNGVGPQFNPSTGTSGSLSGTSGSSFGEDTKIGSGRSSSSGSGSGSTFGSGIRGSNFGSGSQGSTSQSGGRTGSGQFGASGSQTGSGQFGASGSQTGSGQFGASGSQTGSGQFVSSGQVNGQSNPFGSQSVFDQFETGATITRVVQESLTPTVTQTATVDRFVILTDVAFQSVQVTLSDLVVRTLTARTTQIMQTPVNDRVALQTTVVTRPSTLTLTQVQTDFSLVTAVSVDHVTLTHHSYVIRQSTFTTSATQVVTVTATRVRTIIHTDRITSTMYYTITDTVLVKPPQTRLYQ